MGRRKKAVPRAVNAQEQTNRSWNSMTASQQDCGSAVATLVDTIISDDGRHLCMDEIPDESSPSPKRKKTKAASTFSAQNDANLQSSAFRREMLLPSSALDSQLYRFALLPKNKVPSEWPLFTVHEISVGDTEKTSEQAVVLKQLMEQKETLEQTGQKKRKVANKFGLCINYASGGGIEGTSSMSLRPFVFGFVDKVTVWHVPVVVESEQLTMALEHLDRLSSHVQFCLEWTTSNVNEPQLQIYLKSSVFSKLKFPSDFGQLRPHMAEALRNLVVMYYQNCEGIYKFRASQCGLKECKKVKEPDSWDSVNFPSTSTEEPPRENISSFYKKLRRLQLQKKSVYCYGEVDPQHYALIPRLRDYQRDTVKWMLNRELLLEHSQDSEIGGTSNPYFFKIKFLDGTEGFFCQQGGQLIRDAPDALVHSPGGILAEEMGLGKTVEVLACILLNPKDKHYKNTQKWFEPKQNGLDGVVKCVLELLVAEVSSQIDTECLVSQLSPSKGSPRKDKLFASPTGPRLNFDKESFESDTRVMNAVLNCFCPKAGRDISRTTKYRRDFGEGVYKPCQRVICSKCFNAQHKSCVGLTQLPEGASYLCPHCQLKEKPIPAKATLIICPSAICHQWYQEVQKHIRSLSLDVYVYRGVQKGGYVQPHFLAQKDVVITTYETLRTEINYLDIFTADRLRHGKPYMSPPTPLVSLNWWRVCLDEAQMVEGTSTKAAIMCNRLLGVHRWCVSGTPILKSIQDLYGLLLFLGVEPFWVEAWWKRILYDPYGRGQENPLLCAMEPILWRNAKSDVHEQLGIPDQVEKIYWLEFSPIEEHFYRRMHEECSVEARAQLEDYAQHCSFSSLERWEVEQVLRPLLKLRLACCHPQAVRGHFINLKLKKNVTMEKVLEKMIEKTGTECEEAHRQICLALNGMAGLQILSENPTEAAEFYREALRCNEGYKTRVRSDPLQRIHTLHNLSWLLKTFNGKIPPTLRDSNLETERDALVSKHIDRQTKWMNEMKTFKDSVCLEIAKFVSKRKEVEGWWLEVCQVCNSDGSDAALLEKVETQMCRTGGVVSRIGFNFHNLTGLQMLIVSQLDVLFEARGALVDSMASLQDVNFRNVTFIEEVKNCHLRQEDKKGKKGHTGRKLCQICEASEFFDAYEGKLYHFEPGEAGRFEVEEEEEEGQESFYAHIRKGTWADSDVESALKAIFAFLSTSTSLRKLREQLNSGRSLPNCRESGSQHLALFEKLKQEFKALRKLWFAIHAYTASLDEVEMAQERLQLVSTEQLAQLSPMESKALLKMPNVLQKHEILTQLHKFESELTVGRVSIERKLGQLTYLKSLKESSGTSVNVEECPICKNELGKAWSVLTCGHYFCCDCVRVLLRHGGDSFRCAICRQKCLKANISFVSAVPGQRHSGGSSATEGTDELYAESIPVVEGSWSTKLEAVLRCIYKISAKEPQAKMVVFSAWTEILKLLSSALKRNNVQFLAVGLCGTKDTDLELAKFRSPSSPTVLLLPIHSGSRGLNITEATHVLFIEPSLNLATEQQARGRVHRIGQTKVTTVHRFLIQGTIESKIHHVVQRDGANALQMTHGSTGGMLLDSDAALNIGDLYNLFDIS